MAVIETSAGEIRVAVSGDATPGRHVSADAGSLMGTARLSFAVPVNDPVVQGGGLNQWSPVRVRIPDGATTIDIPGWVSEPIQSDGQTATITVEDTSVAFDRNSLEAPSNEAKTSGAHATDIIARLSEGLERRTPVAGGRYSNSFLAWPEYEAPPPFDPNASPIPRPEPFVRQSLQDALATLWDRIYPSKSFRGWAAIPTPATMGSADQRSIRFTVFYTSTTEPFTRVRLRLRTAAELGTVWSNSIRIGIGVDPPFAEYAVPAHAEARDDWFDLTAALQREGFETGIDLRNLTIYLTTAASTRDETIYWRYYGMELEVATDVPDWDAWPVLLGDIDYKGPTFRLPQNEVRTYAEWLQYLTEQTNYEWRLRDDPLILGGAILDWQPTIGTEAVPSANGQDYPLIEEGVLAGAVTTRVDPKQMYSRVRVQIQGWPDVVVSDPEARAAIGLHELTITMGKIEFVSNLAEEQAKRGRAELERVKQPALGFDLPMPFQAGLWSSVNLGDTIRVRLQHAPYTPWSGVVRVVGRSIDESQGTMTLHVGAVREEPIQSTQARATVIPVRREPRAVKTSYDPRRIAFQKLRDVLDLARRTAR